MARPITTQPAKSTIRVRRHRQRKAMTEKFHALLFSIDHSESLFSIAEQLEQLTIEALAYQRQE